MSHIPVLIPAPLLLAAFLVPLAGMLHKGLVPAVALAGSAAAAAFAVLGLRKVIAEGPLHYELGNWTPRWALNTFSIRSRHSWRWW